MLPELSAQREHTTAVERSLGTIVPNVFHHDGQPIHYFRRAWRSACRRAATVREGTLARVVRPDLLERTGSIVAVSLRSVSPQGRTIRIST